MRTQAFFFLAIWLSYLSGTVMAGKDKGNPQHNAGHQHHAESSGSPPSLDSTLAPAQYHANYQQQARPSALPSASELQQQQEESFLNILNTHRQRILGQRTAANNVQAQKTNQPQWRSGSS
jgi:hypothetical protein